MGRLFHRLIDHGANFISEIIDNPIEAGWVVFCWVVFIVGIALRHENETLCFVAGAAGSAVVYGVIGSGR